MRLPAGTGRTRSGRSCESSQGSGRDPQLHRTDEPLEVRLAVKLHVVDETPFDTLRAHGHHHGLAGGHWTRTEQLSEVVLAGSEALVLAGVIITAAELVPMFPPPR